MKTYTLIPKNGKGARWLMNADQLFAGRLVKVHDKEGFETIVNLGLYNICY